MGILVHQWQILLGFVGGRAGDVGTAWSAPALCRTPSASCSCAGCWEQVLGACREVAWVGGWQSLRAKPNWEGCWASQVCLGTEGCVRLLWGDRQTDWLLGPCLLRRVISLGSVAAAPASLHVGGSRRGHLRGRQESGRAAELPSPRRCLPWQPRAGCSAGYHRATWTLSVSVRLGAASKWAPTASFTPRFAA